MYYSDKNKASLRVLLLISQISSLLIIACLWFIGLYIYALKDMGNLTKIFEPIVVFGIFALLWKLKAYTKRAIIQISLKTISIFMSIGITLTSMNLLGFDISLPPPEFVQFNIWLFLMLLSLVFAQVVFRSKFITNWHYERYPPFRVRMERIIFLIPAYNEAQSVGHLVTNIKSLYPESRVVVMDNNSSDETAEIALAAGATVLHEWKQGKGCAIKSGLKYISKFDFDAVIMLDADLTYNPEDALKLINYSASGGYGVILGSRLKGRRDEGSITGFNTIGNYILTFFANLMYGTSHSDICTGYWLFRKEAVELLNEIGLKSSGFGLEAEMVSIFAQNNVLSKDLPISYGNRIAGQSHLQPLNDGIRIFFVLINNWVFSRKSKLLN